MAKEVKINYLAIQLGSGIRKVRTKKEMSLEEVAFRCDISYGYLSRLELGKKNVTVFTLSKILRALNCSIQDII